MENKEKLKYLTEEEREEYLDLSSRKEELETLLLFKDSNGGYSVSDDYGSIGISISLMNTRIEDYKDKLKKLEDFIVARSNIEPPYYWDSKSESVVKPLERIPEETKNTKEEFIKEFCNDHNEEVRWLRGVALDEDHLLTRILLWFDGHRSSQVTQVEPLQNGEREELWNKLHEWSILQSSWSREDDNCPTREEVEKAEKEVDRILDDLLSQSKKESYQSGCEDMLRDTCAKIALFIESESGKSGRKEILKFVESLTNQDKDEK